MDLFLLWVGFWGWVAALWNQFWGYFLPGFYASRTPEQWDAIRNWVTAVGGLIALFVAVITYQANSRTRREAQARLVYAKVVKYEDIAAGGDMKVEVPKRRIEPNTFERTDPAQVGGPVGRRALVPLVSAKLSVNNGSDELIGPIKVQIANLKTGKVEDGVSGTISSIEPNKSDSIELVWSYGPVVGSIDFAPVIIFRDASGHWWRRFGIEPIERIHNDPENTAPSKTEREAQDKLNKDSGAKVPKKQGIPFGARVHRVRRRLKGKSPTP